MIKAKIITIFLVILLFAATLACSIGSKGFTESDFMKWFNSWGKETTQPEETPEETPEEDDKKTDDKKESEAEFLVVL